MGNFDPVFFEEQYKKIFFYVLHDFRVNFFLLKLNDTHGRIFFIYGKK